MNNRLLFSKRFGYPLRVLAFQSAVALPLTALATSHLGVAPGVVSLSQAQPGANAANVPVSGRVTQGKGEGLLGVTVVVKVTTTDGDGNFVLNVVKNSVLQFRFIGFSQQEVTVL